MTAELENIWVKGKQVAVFLSLPQIWLGSISLNPNYLALSIQQSPIPPKTPLHMDNA
jgi:hypothetical protein